MKLSDTDIELERILEAQELACQPRKSDADLAREYALMMDNIYLDVSDPDLAQSQPSRRFFKGGREAWVYDHGKIAELVFVIRD